MDHNSTVQLELPPDLLKALHTLKEGGLLYAVTQPVPPQERQLVPCLIARVPPISKHLATIPWAMTLRSLYYEPEGPLAIIALTLYDRLPCREVVELHGSLIGLRTHLGQLFELQCFLNPTLRNNQLFLQTLVSSPFITTSFYQTDEAMTHQTTSLAPTAIEIQQSAQQILRETQGMSSSPERFLAAQQRFVREHSLF